MVEESVALDFFSGSATVAHAVMRQNAADGGNRKYIMIQFPEVCEDGSDAARAGYKTICGLGKELIRRAGKKIKEDSPLTTQDLDIGFRVFKLNVIKEIAKKQPLRAVFRDSSFANSPSKINVGEIFKLLAPDTRVKVI